MIKFEFGFKMLPLYETARCVEHCGVYMELLIEGCTNAFIYISICHSVCMLNLKSFKQFFQIVAKLKMQNSQILLKANTVAGVFLSPPPPPPCFVDLLLASRDPPFIFCAFMM